MGTLWFFSQYSCSEKLNILILLLTYICNKTAKFCSFLARTQIIFKYIFLWTIYHLIFLVLLPNVKQNWNINKIVKITDLKIEHRPTNRYCYHVLNTLLITAANLLDTDSNKFLVNEGGILTQSSRNTLFRFVLLVMKCFSKSASSSSHMCLGLMGLSSGVCFRVATTSHRRQ